VVQPSPVQAFHTPVQRSTQGRGTTRLAQPQITKLFLVGGSYLAGISAALWVRLKTPHPHPGVDDLADDGPLGRQHIPTSVLEPFSDLDPGYLEDDRGIEVELLVNGHFRPVNAILLGRGIQLGDLYVDGVFCDRVSEHLKVRMVRELVAHVGSPTLEASLPGTPVSVGRRDRSQIHRTA
jgi:hypothetical protein